SAPELGPSETIKCTGLCGHDCAAAAPASASETMQAAMASLICIMVSSCRYTRRERVMTAIRKVGMLGLGKMGAPMARHLIAKGYNVAGYDPVDAARQNAAALGVTLCRSPRDVAQAAELVIVVVGFDHEVETVMLGAGGVMEAARPGLMVAIGSTVAPGYAK